MAKNKEPLIEGFSGENGAPVFPVVDKKGWNLISVWKAVGSEHWCIKMEKLEFLEAAVKAESAAKEEDCDFLYDDLYLPFVDENECDGAPEAIGAMATLRPYNLLEGDPRLDLDAFHALAKYFCETKTKIARQEFGKKVCGGA